MSEESAQNNIYNTENLPEVSEIYIPVASIKNDMPEIDSSGSSINLNTESVGDNNYKPNYELVYDNNYSHVEDVEDTRRLSVKTESVRSLWSATDASHNYEDNHILPNDASPLIFDGRIISYNTNRGVDYDTPVLFGPSFSKRSNTGDEKASRFIFDPKTGTLVSGFDINNNKPNLPNFSLITGIGNLSELDASFISGVHNSINLNLLPDNQNPDDDQFLLIPPSCAIIGGTNNNITNNSVCQNTSAIIGSHNVNINNCDASVAIGIKGITGDFPISGLTETTIVRNLLAMGHVNAGPYNNETFPQDTVFVANGNALIQNDLQVNGNINSKSWNTDNLVIKTANIENLNVSGLCNIDQRDIYIEGTGGITGINVTILPQDNVDIIYANPTNGTVNIYLGTGANNIFQRSRMITIKDVTLEFEQASAYNINIIVRGPSDVVNQTKIEHYNNGGLTAGANAGYAINTSGGSVSFRFINNIMPGFTPTWVIQNQFIGNPRIQGTAGIKFMSASENTRYKLFHK